MTEKAFITGATGFIGANLTRRLLDEGYEVFVLLRKSSNIWRIKDILNKLHLIYADISDLAALKKAMADFSPDYIFHLATYGAYPDMQEDEEKIIKTNIIGTYNLLQVTKDIGYKCFINAGSSSEYGIKDSPMSENDLLEPKNMYGASKASVSLLCQSFSRVHDKNVVTLRPFSVYGPYEEGFRLIPTVIINCLNNKNTPLTSGEQKRDFIFVDDFIDVYLKVMNMANISGEIFNVGSGTDTTIKEVSEKICKLANRGKNLLEFGKKKMRTAEAIKSWKADTSKIKNVLNYEPKNSLDDGIKKTLDWFSKNIHLYD